MQNHIRQDVYQVLRSRLGSDHDEVLQWIVLTATFEILNDPEQEVVFESDLVRFLQDRRYQGTLKHSVIIPITHRETVFDLGDAEIAATF